MFLTEIYESKKREVQARRKNLSQEDLIREVSSLPPTRDFKAALTAPNLGLIAEVKKASPSRGVIRENFNPVEIAKVYEESGASAISVLTEEKYFQGSLEFLSEIKKVSNLPLLCKDFILNSYQLYEARFYGADAILLIAAILDQKNLSNLYSLAKKLDLDPLVEVHTQEELEKALEVEAEIIGINNRDLNTFEVDISTTPRLIKRIPPGKVVVSESGIKTKDDVEFLEKAGINAILIGESLMEAEDIGAKIKELL